MATLYSADEEVEYMGIIKQIVEESFASPHEVLVESGIPLDLYIIVFDIIITGKCTQRVRYQHLPAGVH